MASFLVSQKKQSTRIGPCGDEVLLYNYDAISLTSLFAFFKTLRVELKQLTLLTFTKSFSVQLT